MTARHGHRRPGGAREARRRPRNRSAAVLVLGATVAWVLPAGCRQVVELDPFAPTVDAWLPGDPPEDGSADAGASGELEAGDTAGAGTDGSPPDGRAHVDLGVGARGETPRFDLGGPAACRSAGDRCVEASECCTGACPAGHCALDGGPCAPFGRPCARDDECCSGVCDEAAGSCGTPSG